MPLYEGRTNISDSFPKSEGETITLHDGRKIGFSEYKYQLAIPFESSPAIVLIIPGLPGTRLFCHPLVRKNQAISGNSKFGYVRIIVLERPGVGLSTFAKRTFLEFAQDVKEFCIKKKITRCSILAYSAGG